MQRHTLLILHDRAKRFHRGTRIVDGVVAAGKYLRCHVRDTGKFEDRAHRGTGNKTATRRRTDLDDRRAVLRADVALDGIRLCKIEGDHVALRGTRGLLDRELRIGRFPQSDPHAALLVAEDHADGEVEAAPACHDARDAADAKHLLRELRAALIASAARPSRGVFPFSSAELTATSVKPRSSSMICA